jgi:hypothetical protein
MPCSSSFHTWISSSSFQQSFTLRGGVSFAARDSKREQLRKDPRAAPPFCNLKKFSKSYSKPLEKDFSFFFLKEQDSKSFFQTIEDALLLILLATMETASVSWD